MADPRTQLKGGGARGVVRRNDDGSGGTDQPTFRTGPPKTFNEIPEPEPDYSKYLPGLGGGLVSGPIGSAVSDAADAASDAVSGAAEAIGLTPQPIPEFPAFQVDPRAQQNFQGLVNAPALQPQQVVGGGSIAGQVPTVTPQSITAAQLNTNDITAAQKLGLQTRGQQQGAIGQLQQAAAGAVPSAAQIQGGQQLDAAMRNQLALASSARGGAAQQAAAQRQAQMGIGQLQQSAIGDAAALRAQEQATARDTLSGALLGVRGQDAALQQLALQQSGAQAQLGQQAALANQSAGLQGGIANQGAVLAALQADQANQFRVDSANQSAGLQAAGLDIQRQLGGAQGVLGAQELAALAQFRPQGLQADMFAAERARQAQVQAALLQGGASLVTKLTGLG